MSKKVALGGVFSALIFVFTAYLYIPAGNSGYMHIGDSFIYLCASILPKPLSIISAVVGASLADFLTGNAVWVLPTIFIKAILVLFFENNSERILTKRNIFASVVSGVVGTVLYMICGGFIYGFEGAFLVTLVTLIQPIGSFILYFVFSKYLDKIDFVKKQNILK